MIIDLTPVLDGAGCRATARHGGRPLSGGADQVAGQPATGDQVDVVAMDGFGGYKTAATEVLPQATTVSAAESLDSFDPLSPWVVADARRRSSARLLGAVGVSPTARPRRAIAVASGARAR